MTRRRRNSLADLFRRHHGMSWKSAQLAKDYEKRHIPAGVKRLRPKLARALAQEQNQERRDIISALRELGYQRVVAESAARAARGSDFDSKMRSALAAASFKSIKAGNPMARRSSREAYVVRWDSGNYSRTFSTKAAADKFNRSFGGHGTVTKVAPGYQFNPENSMAKKRKKKKNSHRRAVKRVRRAKRVNRRRRNRSRPRRRVVHHRARRRNVRRRRRNRESRRGRVALRRLGRKRKTGGFARIAARAAREYGSAAAGRRVAGSIYWRMVRRRKAHRNPPARPKVIKFGTPAMAKKLARKLRAMGYKARYVKW